MFSNAQQLIVRYFPSTIPTYWIIAAGQCFYCNYFSNFIVITLLLKIPAHFSEQHHSRNAFCIAPRPPFLLRNIPAMCVGMHGFKIGDTKIITCLKLGERKNVRLRAIFRFQHLSPNTLSGTASSRQTIHPSFPSWRKNNRVSLFAIRDAVQTWICRYTP